MNLHRLFPGTGEMAGLARALDWSKTPVGPVETWPQSLRTAFGIALESKFGTMVAWGPELTHFYNDAYRPILGSSKHPSLGKSVPDVFPEIWPTIGPLFEGVRQGKAFGFDDLLVPMDRHGFLEECYFTFSYSPIRDETGSVGGIQVTVTETTGRVVGERRLQTLRDLAERASEMRQEEQAWREVAKVISQNPFDVPFALFYRLESDGVTLRRMAQMGWGEETFSEGPMGPFAEVALARKPRLISDLQTLLSDLPGGPWPEPPRSALVLPIARGDRVHGVLVAGLSARLALDDGYRDFLQLVAEQVATAVSHGRAYSEEKARTEALRQADQRKDEFLAMLAHELRNPMAAISLSLAMLERTNGDVLKSAQYREMAKRQMANLVRLVDDLLDVSRISRGVVELRKEKVDLSTIVANAVAATRASIEARRHAFSVTVAPGPFILEADSTRLEQVVTNLLTNATKYTDPGGAISLVVSYEKGNGNGSRYAVIRVRDTGRGIPRDMLEKVFDMFVQVSPTVDRSLGGLGLGLTLVKRLVALHGGTTEVRSQGTGKGSEFVVRLPLAKERPLTASKPLPSSSSGNGTSGRRRILLVEDSEDVRETLREFLEDLGHEVLVAADGSEGVSKLLESRPDVALIDVGLPGIDGYEVARQIRAVPGGDKLYLVALTGYGGPEARAKAEGAGFDLHLTKPVNITELPEVVRWPRGYVH